MKKRFMMPFVVVVALAAILAIVSVVFAASAKARRATVDGRESGEVLIDNTVVIRFQAAAGDLSPFERAQTVADRLDGVLERNSDWRQFSVQTSYKGNGVYAGDRLITSVTREDASAADRSVATLAYDWRDNIIRALNGDVPDRKNPRPDSDTTSGEYSDWEGRGQKWVPILDVGNQGVRIGAAQVAGPETQVDKVKAVAQLDLDFRKVARVRVYVPISSLNVIKLDRVQGVSVWAVGDLKVLKF